jgi:hypothetical protein
MGTFPCAVAYRFAEGGLSEQAMSWSVLAETFSTLKTLYYINFLRYREQFTIIYDWR